MRNEMKLEKKIEHVIEKYMNVDFYEDQESENERENESPYSLIMDLSDIKPGEIEIEDEIKLGYLWIKHQKRIK